MSSLWAQDVYHWNIGTEKRDSKGHEAGCIEGFQRDSPGALARAHDKRFKMYHSQRYCADCFGRLCSLLGALSCVPADKESFHQQHVPEDIRNDPGFAGISFVFGKTDVRENLFKITRNPARVRFSADNTFLPGTGYRFLPLQAAAEQFVALSAAAADLIKLTGDPTNVQIWDFRSKKALSFHALLSIPREGHTASLLSARVGEYLRRHRPFRPSGCGGRAIRSHFQEIQIHEPGRRIELSDDQSRPELQLPFRKMELRMSRFFP